MSRRFASTGFLVLVAAAAVAFVVRSSRGGCRGADYADVAVVEGDRLCSTADRAAAARILKLLGMARDAPDLEAVTIDYPQDASIFPPDFAAPTFLWHDAAGERWLADIELDGGAARIRVLVPGAPPPAGEIDPRCITATNEIYRGTEYQQSARSWRPSAALWAAIRRRASEQPATIAFLGYREGEPERVVSRGVMTLTTARDPVGAPIFYRDVPLMPAEGKEGVIQPLDKNAVPLIAWRLRDVSRDESRVMLRDMPSCANCHSFSRDGTTMGMDVDGPDGDKGAYTVVPIARQVVIDDPQVITWNAFPGKPEGLNTLGFLAQVSPDGKYAVATVNEALYVRNFKDYRFGQVFYPTRGILAVYSRETGKIFALPGADDPRYVHCDAVWTPDGKSLIFARAEARDPYPPGRPLATYAGDPNELPIQYDLYRMPFDEGRGGTPEPLEGASFNKMSNTFPKVTPDGRFVVFVQCKNGQLMRPDGRLFIVPLAGGAAREMRCNTSRMNSWHSFSPNGRWMVFSSKADTPYTQMFLTHLDEHGNDSPPILIENATAANRAVNIPEFVNVAFDEFQSISVPAVDHYVYFARGNELARAGKAREAVAEFERAFDGGYQAWRVNDWRIHDSLSKTLLELGEVERAIEHARESLKLFPFNWEMQANLGYLLFERGEVGQALEHLDMAIRLNPRGAKLWSNRAALRVRLGDAEGALGDYTRAIEINPYRGDAWIGRGILRKERGDLHGAIEDFSAAIEREPGTPGPWLLRALARESAGDLRGAATDAGRAGEVAPPEWEHGAELGELSRRLARPRT